MQYNRIRELREERNLTQRQIAELLQINPRTYSRYERGMVTVPLRVFCGLADTYHTSVDYLLGITDQRTPYEKRT